MHTVTMLWLHLILFSGILPCFGSAPGRCSPFSGGHTAAAARRPLCALHHTSVLPLCPQGPHPEARGPTQGGVCKGTCLAEACLRRYVPS